MLKMGQFKSAIDLSCPLCSLADIDKGISQNLLLNCLI